MPGVRDSAVVGAPLPGIDGRARAGRAAARAGHRPRRRRAQRERAARRSPEDPRRGGVAGDRAAADRRHAQAEAPRAASSGWSGSRPAEPAAPAPPERGGRACATVLARFAPGPHDRAGDDDRRARAELARARRADDGARGSVPGHGGRRRVRRRRDRRATWRRWRAADSSAGAAPAARIVSRAAAESRSTFPVVEPHACRARRSGARACRPGSCRSAGSSRASTVEGLEHLAGARRAGDLRREPSEPLRRAR